MSCQPACPQPSLPTSAAGLEPDGTPYLCGMDSIGAQETAKDFMVAGTATDSLLGICESLWRPDLVGPRGGGLGGPGGGVQTEPGIAGQPMPRLWVAVRCASELEQAIYEA